MATSLSVGDVVQYTMMGYLNNQLGEMNTHWLVTLVVGAGGTDQDFCGHMDNLVSTPVKNLMTDLAVYIGSQAQIIYPTRYVAVHDVLNSGFGLAGSLPLPTQVRGLLSLQTATAGRAYRGRVYPFFPDQASQAGTTGFPLPAYVTAVGVLGAILIASQTVVLGADSVTLVPVIFHRKAGKGGVPAAGSTTPVLNYAARPVWATQRKSGDLGRTNPRPF